MAKAAYHVHGRSITKEPQLNEAGTAIEDVHVIPYTIDSGPAKGHRGHVKVPHDQYSTAAVEAALEDAVNITHDVASLGQPAPGIR